MKKILIKILILILIIGAIITSLYLYSRHIGTKGIKVNEIGLKTEITDNFNGLKIVHISDIKYGSTTNIEKVEELVEKVNETKPDIIIFTGDLLADNYTIKKEEIELLTASLSKLEANLAKYAISGDNDIQYENYNIFLENINFINIDNNVDTIYKDDLNYILISGLSSIKDKTKNKLNNYNEYLENNKENLPIYKIMILHEPILIDEINIEDFNLILGGHSLGNQINFPLIENLTKLDNIGKYENLIYEKENIYISNGIGTTELHLRFNNRPSFNFYRIKAGN